MNTKAKSNSVISSVIGDNKIFFEVLGVGQLVLDFAKMNSAIIERAAMHGMVQRISDAAAIPRDLETGESATAQDKFDAMQRLVSHYESGTAEWSRRPQPGEGKSGGLLFKALCVMSAETKTPAEIKEWMTGKTKAQLTALRNQPKIAEVINSLRPVSMEVDTDALLDELNA